MFSFDPNLIPDLPTKKALLAIDFQRDFLPPPPLPPPSSSSSSSSSPSSSPGPAAGEEAEKEEEEVDTYTPLHPITHPTDTDALVRDVVRLASRFRETFNVVCWVDTKFLLQRNPSKELPKPPDAAGARERTETNVENPDDEYPDAFLSTPGGGPGPGCVRERSPGQALHPLIRSTLEANPRDLHMTKTYYSAFKCPDLLQRLRRSFVTELFICGSLANAGVYATAIEAAGHGYDITLVDSCCGWTDKARRDAAISQLVEITGCEVVSDFDEVARLVEKKAKSPGKRAEEGDDADASTFLEGAMAGLRLSRDDERKKRKKKKKKGSTKSTDELVEEADAKGGAKLGQSDSSTSVEAPSTDPAGKDPARGDLDRGAGEEEGVSLAQQDTGPSGADKEGGGKSAGANADVLPALVESATKDRGGPESEDVEDQSRQDREDKHAIGSIGLENLSLNDGPATTAKRPSESTAARERVAKDLENSGTDKPASASASTPQDTQELEEPSGVPLSAVTAGDDDPPVNPPNEPLCEGDTIIIPDLLQAPLSDTIFDALLAEVAWQSMSHQGGEVPRLVAVQGAVDPADGSIPVYRHPADASPPLLPFTPSVLAIKAEVEKRLGHEVNHVLIQHYRSGNDFISEHSDKTLDIQKDSFICNVSLGAQRTMTFRTKRDAAPPKPESGKDDSGKEASRPAASGDDPGSPKRTVVRAKLPHNSLCRMGLRTNMKWLHAIRPDKRPASQKGPEDLAYAGARISLTFRRIGTFLSADETLIWGQGATSKAREGARPVINGQGPEAVRMLYGFGTENHSSGFDWDKHYGEGFDVLHMRAAPRLFTGADPVANMRVSLMLAECGLGYARGSATGTKEPLFAEEEDAAAAAGAAAAPSPQPALSLLDSRPIKFCDVDNDKSRVEGEVPILLYLDQYYSKARRGRSQGETARQLTRLQHGITLQHKWRVLTRDEASGKRSAKLFRNHLALLDTFVSEEGFMGGGAGASIADFGIWPVLHAVVHEVGGEEAFKGLEKLGRYYEQFGRREAVATVLEKKGRGKTPDSGREEEEEQRDEE